MNQILLTIGIASITQIATLLIVHGFEKSYWGANAVQEITRFFNRYCKHYQKTRKKK